MLRGFIFWFYIISFHKKSVRSFIFFVLPKSRYSTFRKRIKPPIMVAIVIQIPMNAYNNPLVLYVHVNLIAGM